MVRIFKTIEGSRNPGGLLQYDQSATEIFEMSERFGIEVDDLRAPLDEEEHVPVLKLYTDPGRCSYDRGTQ